MSCLGLLCINLSSIAFSGEACSEGPTKLEETLVITFILSPELAILFSLYSSGVRALEH